MATSKIRLRNCSGISEVRFRGVHFSQYQFSVDVADGGTLELDQIPVGDIGLVAYRKSDGKALDSLAYPVLANQGFAAVLIARPDTAPQEYMLVGEPFIVE